MADELQDLLQRIEKDGLEKAEAAAARIEAEAAGKARATREAAEADAAAIRAAARAEAEALVERGKRSLEQAARDVVLLIGQSVAAMFRDLAHQRVTQALGPDFLKKVLASSAEKYLKAGGRTGRLELLLNPDEQKALAEHLLAAFSEEMRRGITLQPSPVIASGIRVRVVEENVMHDFTAEAVTAALCELVRPYLAEIVRGAATSAGLNVADKPRA